MNTDALYDKFTRKAIVGLESSKNIYTADMFSDCLLFDIGDPGYYEMSRLLSNWRDSIPTLFSELMRSIAECYSYETSDLLSSMWPKTGFLFRKASRRLGCVVLWPNLKYSPLDDRKDNVVFSALRMVQENGLDAFQLVWLANDDESELNDHIASCNEAFSHKGVEYISALDWFSQMFGNDETSKLKDVAAMLRMKGRSVQRITTAPLPSKLELLRFQSDMRSSYKSEIMKKTENRLVEKGFDPDDLEIIKSNLVANERCEVLFGGKDFAESLLASEWRFRLNFLSENIEQTGTVAGYIKSVEQLMFGLLTLWADKGLEAAFGAGSKREPLTSAFIEKKKRDASLGALQHLFASWKYSYFNEQIYDPRLKRNKVRELLWNCLDDFLDNTRNGKFHKSNFKDLGAVAAIRDCVFDIAYILLGSICLDEMQLDTLNSWKPVDNLEFHYYEAMRSSLNQQLDDNGCGPIKKAHFFADGRQSERGFWIIALGYSIGEAVLVAQHYCKLPEGLSFDEQLALVDKMIKRYIQSDCANSDIPSLIDAYQLYESYGNRCVSL